ncbi:MAG: hypothetical protein V1897_05310 [Pseudomonadota bacterium]
MVTYRNTNFIILTALALLTLLPSTCIPAKLYAPDYLWKKGISEKTDPVEIADTHVGIPYRDDGTLDDQGRFTSFDRPDRFFDTPGLNCSGLVLSVSRFLFDRNWTIDEARRDRQGNSGAGSSLGKDWDFGFDLILNLTDGVERRAVMPDNQAIDLNKADGINLRGFGIDDRQAWSRVIRQMKPGYAYFGDISKPSNELGYKLIHYHVVIAIPDGTGNVWLYHATQRSSTHKMNINSPQGLSRFMSQFRGARGDTKDILFIEAKLPDLNATAQEPQGATNVENDKDSFRKDKPAPQQTGSSTTPVNSQSNVAVQQPPQMIESSQYSKTPSSDSTPGPQTPEAPVVKIPELEIYHQAGKVYNRAPDIVTHIPKFGDPSRTSVVFVFQNRADSQREINILLRTPTGELQYDGKIPASTNDFKVIFPRDFGKSVSGNAAIGQYVEEVTIDGKPWLANVFEIAKPREAAPKILNVKVPKEAQAGKTFTISVQAQNKGAESDYGGITVSSPDPAGLRIVSAKPGRVYPASSTVLSVTTDKIRTKVPMAEQWIELWGENKIYEMQVQVQAGKPGNHALYVRCAIRGVNVKSSVILMDPESSDTVDQQGFPVYVYMINVR